jgi:hypothetical protein
MTTLQPGESKDFVVPEGGVPTRLKVDVRVDLFAEPAFLLAFWGGCIAFGWIFGWMLGALV